MYSNEFNMETIKVIFKKDEGEVVAIFPYMRANDRFDFTPLATCYAHIGQHSACSYDYGTGLPTATKSEYRDLLSELQMVYGKNVRFQILQRLPARRFIWNVLKHSNC